jgi:hypothetical protein
MLQIISYLAVGLMAGFFSGLLGIGGGVIIVPALVLLMGFAMRTAIGTSLAIVIPTALAGAIFHFREGNLYLGAIVYVSIAAVAGSRLGVYLTTIVSNATLRKVFGVVMLVIALRMILGK